MLPEATMSMTSQAMGENPGDDALLVRFFLHPVQDSAKTAEEGRPIFIEKEHIEIKVPGNRRTAVARVARERDIERFPRHYAAFKNRVQGSDGSVGTPLAEWTPLPRTLVEEFAYFNVKSIEGLAAINDGHLDKHPSFLEWREKAKKYLERSALEAEGMKLDSVMERLAALEARNQELEAELEDATKPTPKAKKSVSKDA